MKQNTNFGEKKKVPKHKTDKIIKIFEKILDFNKEQKGKRLKKLTPKQILQRLRMRLAQATSYSVSDIQDYFGYITKKRSMEKRRISSNKNM